MRDLLLCVESNTGPNRFCFFIDYSQEEVQLLIGRSPIEPPEYQVELEKKYHNDVLMYHLKQCAEDGLIDFYGTIPAYQSRVADLTPKGHEFLAKIRDDKVADATRKACKGIGNITLAVIGEIAEGVTKGCVSRLMNLP